MNPEVHLEKRQHRFVEKARLVRGGRQELVVKLYRELTEGKVAWHVLEERARKAAADDGRRVRSDAVPCLIGIWYLLGQPAVKNGNFPYGTLRRYAAAVQYGLDRKWSWGNFENNLEELGLTAMSQLYDNRKRSRRRYGGRKVRSK
jgi:hypothetical protein